MVRTHERKDANKGALAQLQGLLGISGMFAGFASIVSSAAIVLSAPDNRLAAAGATALVIIVAGIIFTVLGLLCLNSAWNMIPDERPSIISSILRRLWVHRRAILVILTVITILISILLISLAVVISAIAFAIKVIHDCL